MPKLIATLNMTLDGICDHTAGIPDAELHRHYTALLNQAGTLLYGRTTYQLMESFWPTLVKTPSGEPDMDDFALAIDKVPKIVFSRTLSNVDWASARLSKRSVQEEVLELKRQPGKDIYAGSPSLIVQTLNLGLVDELQICVHPVIAGEGLPLFKGIKGRMVLNLIGTKTFASGILLQTYVPRLE